jgi:hypothetical protein
MYREGDLLVATNGSIECVICRIMDVSTGSMMGFIGKVVGDTSDELEKVGVGFEEYKRSFRRTYNAGIEAEKNMLRVEFGYEPVPLEPIVVEVLKPYAKLRDDPLSKLLDRQPQNVMDQCDMEFFEEMDKACLASVGKDQGAEGENRSGATTTATGTKRGRRGT